MWKSFQIYHKCSLIFQRWIVLNEWMAFSHGDLLSECLIYMLIYLRRHEMNSSLNVKYKAKQNKIKSKTKSLSIKEEMTYFQ